MTQLEKLIARIKSLDPSHLYEIMIYVTPDGMLGFWIVNKKAKTEGEICSKIIESGSGVEVPQLMTHKAKADAAVGS